MAGEYENKNHGKKYLWASDHFRNILKSLENPKKFYKFSKGISKACLKRNYQKNKNHAKKPLENITSNPQSFVGLRRGRENFEVIRGLSKKF